MSPGDILTLVTIAVLGTVSVVGMSMLGWTYNTRQKIKHGYPLESMGGRPLHPQLTSEANERVKLLTQENAQLRAELGALHDRTANLERIVTDSGYRLGHEIESLRDRREKAQ